MRDNLNCRNCGGAVGKEAICPYCGTPTENFLHMARSEPFRLILTDGNTEYEIRCIATQFDMSFSQDYTTLYSDGYAVKRCPTMNQLRMNLELEAIPDVDEFGKASLAKIRKLSEL